MKNRLLLTIAYRYWRSKKSFSIVNIISRISFWGVAIGVAALIIVLSVFNGFEGMVTEMFNTFNPDFKITAKAGKSFDHNAIDIRSIESIDGIQYCCGVFEEVALLRYGSKQQVVKVKGIPEDGLLLKKMESAILDGEYKLKQDSAPLAVVGAGIVYKLGISLHDPLKTLQLLSPSISQNQSQGLSSEFSTVLLRMSGFFSIQQDFDDNYIIVPIDVCDSLFSRKGRITSVEILVDKNANAAEIEKQLKKKIGNDFSIKNRFQQEEALFKIMKTEKLVVFIILAFILLLASLNIISVMGLLILDKRLDASVLNALGLSLAEIKRVFRYQGVLIISMATLSGLVIGTTIVLLQGWFGIVPMNGGESILIDAYPVRIVWTDFLFIALITFTFGLILVRIPVKKIGAEFISFRKHQN